MKCPLCESGTFCPVHDAKHMLVDQKSRKECKTKCGKTVTADETSVWWSIVDCPECLTFRGVLWKPS